MGKDVTRRETLKVGIAAAVVGTATEGRAGVAAAPLTVKGVGPHFKTNKHNTFYVIGSGFDPKDKPQVALSGNDEAGNPVNFKTDKDPKVIDANHLRVRTFVTKRAAAGKQPPGGFGFADLTITVTTQSNPTGVTGMVSDVSYDDETT